MNGVRENLGKSLKDIFQRKYVIPLYQRNFAWRSEEISQLLQDLVDACESAENHNYYIGSLVTLKRHNGEFEVIDGQQRLTTLSLISKMLGVQDHPILSYDSRPNVDEFFAAFYHDEKAIDNLTYSDVFYLKEAVTHIRSVKLEHSKERVSFDNLRKDQRFKNYFLNKVFLVSVEIPEDTDVAAYFEIMNNRGEQLQKHEIVKAQLISKIGSIAKQKQFAEIWDACSQMDIPIQRAFSAERRKQYFSDNYCDFSFDVWDVDNSSAQENKSYCIQEILKGPIVTSSSGATEYNNNDNEYDIFKYRSIIDWSNFLMHVLKLYAPEKMIQLNEKFLLDSFKVVFSESMEENVLDFAQTLLFCRMVFDRFVVKVTTDTKKEDDFTWQLIKPQKYDKSWKYINTFGDFVEHETLVKALSMLQVTFRTRIYKNYLQNILQYFYKKWKLNLNWCVSAREYLFFLHGLMCTHYDENNLSQQLGAGIATSHFLFNFIDYLYWQRDRDMLKDFEFKYWNSVEHHYPQQIAREKNMDDNILNLLGNLCLISKSANSRLSDRTPKEKAERYESSNMGPKRQIMYATTRDYDWDAEKIKLHHKDIVQLLELRKEILGLLS